MAVHRNKSATITIRVTPEIKKLAKQAAESQGRTVTQHIEWLVAQDVATRTTERDRHKTA